MIIKYTLDTATNKLELGKDGIVEVAATYDLVISIKSIPASMIDRFHNGVRKILFEFGWDGSIGDKRYSKIGSKKAQPTAAKI